MILSPAAEIYRRFKQKQQLFDWFEPFPYQREAYLSSHPVQLIEGGNRSGKTHLAIAKIVAIATQQHPTIHKQAPLKIRIIANVMREGAMGIILRKIKELLPTIYLRGGSWDEGYRATDNMITLRNLTTLQLMAATQDLQTHRGDDVDIAMIDEECPEDIFDETLTRLADRAGMLIFSMTPHNGMTWSYKKLVKASRRDPQIGYFHLNTLSNYRINRKEWVKRSALFSDKEFAIRVKGERVANEGLVYFMVSDKTHTIQPFDLPPGTHLFLGVDFGINNPHAGSLWAITPSGKMFIVDEYYETGKTVSENATAQGRWVGGKWGQFKLRWVACDPNSGAQRNEQTNETNLHIFKKSFCPAYGKTIPILSGDRTKGCVEHRVDKMREYLTLGPQGLPDLMIFSSCVNTLNEFDEYVWGTRKNEDMNQFERPMDKHNHLMNACEYVAERNPSYMKYIDVPRETVRIELQYGAVGR